MLQAPILVTGVAGFIGFHVARRLLDSGEPVIGLDNLNPYYDPALKHARLAQLTSFKNFRFLETDIAQNEALEAAFTDKPKLVIHLAAQAGVRYGSQNPHAYTQSNLVGFMNVLEACRAHPPQHLVYASSSSVYGANARMPFSEHHGADHPLSLYAATKKANESLAHAYSHLYSLPVTGLRFFTVYGPWGRPDMALYIFSKAILEGRPLPVFNQGEMQRDFTYIDDIVEGVLRIAARPPQMNTAWNALSPDPATSQAPCRIYNIGHNAPVRLNAVITLLEQALGCKAQLDFQPMQKGDVPATYADISDLEGVTGWVPQVSIEEGIARFVGWFRDWYNS
jgi:UDP-glucuronate 4-epimerase